MWDKYEDNNTKSKSYLEFFNLADIKVLGYCHVIGLIARYQKAMAEDGIWSLGELLKSKFEHSS
jgi:hypothetical protein